MLLPCLRHGVVCWHCGAASSLAGQVARVRTVFIGHPLIIIILFIIISLIIDIIVIIVIAISMFRSGEVGCCAACSLGGEGHEFACRGLDAAAGRSSGLVAES